MKMAQKSTLASNAEKVFNIIGIDEDPNHDFRCICPIHSGDKNNFSYYSTYGRWKCWSNQCHDIAGGDLIGLMAAYLGCSRSEASDRLGISSTPHRARKPGKKRSLTTIDPSQLNEQTFVSKYFEGRGFLKTTISHFQGFDSTDPKKNMYNRAIIPLYDESGGLVGYTGRTIKNSTIKWLHTPKGLIKSLLLYNLNNIHNTDSVILVEGPLDVWKLYECGIYNSVAILGTEISQDQILLLKNKGIKKIILMLDPDSAGKRATLNNISNKLVDIFKVYSLRHLLDCDIGEMKVFHIINNIKPKIEEICKNQ